MARPSSTETTGKPETTAKAEAAIVVRSFPAIAEPDARILILGSMPGVASLTAHRYYAHPHNGFWPIMARILEFRPDLPYEERCRSLTAAGIALWDVLQQCVRPGSLDASIEHASVVPNDIEAFLRNHSGVKLICFNGAAAEQLFRRHVLPDLTKSRLPAMQRLPSTSPAHASLRFEQKLALWLQALGPTLASPF
ncbi:DNA-deoxyinosine glycosylase [Uliginosibacterium paludis]|uniref:DNA-deoxyinosine glycosylase n=1 Tax=Uliginosibacterium paludis TaxID=1615952 RepID=A0ABV2CKG1_9RHOO